MKIRVKVNHSVPTKHGGILHPSVAIEDNVQPGETPMEAYRRISLMATAMFAREILDQLRYADRMAQSNEQWCDEYLSTVAEDHPAMNVVPNDVVLPDNVKQLLEAVGKAIGDAAMSALEEAGLTKLPTPPEG